MRVLWPSIVVLAVGMNLGCDPRAVCLENVDCPSPLVCVFDSEEEKRFCEPPCAADLPCPAGEACIEREDGSFEGACLRVTENRAVGEPCVEDRECGSAACGGDGEDKFCLEPCSLEDPCSDPAERCILDGLRRVCAAPLDDRGAGEDCADPRECSSGTCVERPDVELTQCLDNCVVPEDCPVAGDTCVRVTGGARVCLPPLPDGSICQSSTACAGDLCLEDGDRLICASPCDASDTCSEGFVCVDACARNCGEAGQENVRACIPLVGDGLAPGDTCTTPRECLSGFCATFENVEPGGVTVTICAEPCGANGECVNDPALFFCWPVPDEQGPDLCGPEPD